MIFPEQCRINASLGLKSNRLPRDIVEIGNRIVSKDEFVKIELITILARLKRFKRGGSKHMALGGTWSEVFIERVIREFTENG